MMRIKFLRARKVSRAAVLLTKIPQADLHSMIPLLSKTLTARRAVSTATLYWQLISFMVQKKSPSASFPAAILSQSLSARDLYTGFYDFLFILFRFFLVNKITLFCIKSSLSIKKC